MPLDGANADLVSEGEIGRIYPEVEFEAVGSDVIRIDLQVRNGVVCIL